VVAILQIVSWNSVGQFQIYESNDLKHFIYNLLFISGWGYFGADSFNAPIWSVSAEIFSYAAFFFLLPSMRKFKFAVPAILICLFYLLMYLHFPLMNLWTCAFYFFSGCFLYSIYSKYQSNVLIFLTLLVLSFFSLYLELLKIFYVLIFSSIVILFSQFEEKTTFFKKNKLIGDITYGVYLWHIPFHILTLLIFMHLKIDFIWFQNTIFFICFNILIILFSIFSFKYIEDPIRRKYRNSIF
jgi:peptidoglycan/LPS O-acetylase OafA/YrhL